MAESLNDRELLRDFALHGSESAFRTVVERHIDLVFATALRRLGDAATAEEVSQDVFVTLAQKARWLSGETSLVGWLHKTTVFKARQWWRSEFRRQQREQTAANLGSTMKDDESLLKSLAGVLDEGLMELRESDRQALMLRYFEGRTHREVAATLGVNEDAARKRIDKALDRLTDAFRRRGYAIPAASVAAAALRAGGQVAPAGLTTTITQAALSVGGAGAATGLGLTLAKIMALTKTQITLACLVVAAAPVAYQWHRLSAAASAQRRLTAQLTELRTSINEREHDLGSLRRRVFASEAAIAAFRGATNRGLPAGNAIASAELYTWDEHSDYVRLPKALLAHVSFGDFRMEPRGRARTERVQQPALAKDGTPSPALLDALGLASDQAQQVSDTTHKAFDDFDQLSASHSYLTNQAYLPDGSLRGVTLATPAFPDEGMILRQSFSNSMVQLIGGERTAAFWQQAERIFADDLNSFGDAPKNISAYLMGNGSNMYPLVEINYYGPDGASRGTHSGPASMMDVPEPLKPYVQLLSGQSQIVIKQP